MNMTIKIFDIQVRQNISGQWECWPGDEMGRVYGELRGEDEQAAYDKDQAIGIALGMMARLGLPDNAMAVIPYEPRHSKTAEFGYTPKNLRDVARWLADSEGRNGRERIAEILGVTVRSVHRWCVDADRPSHEPMPYQRWTQLMAAIRR